MEQVKNLKTGAFDNYHLRFLGQNLNAKYGCSVFFDDGKSQNEIRYKLDIAFNGDLENGIKKYTINREDKIYVNDVVQNNFIDILALETSKCLYPLEIKTNTYGEIIKILNFEEIINRWIETKEKLKENYKSSLTEKYIKATNKSLLSKEVLLDKISKDWLINLYFNSLYKFYSDDLYINEKLSYPVLSGIKPLEYKVTSKIKLNKDSKDIRLDINGVIDDERCALDLEQGLDTPHYKELNKNEKSLLGTCNLIYLFEENTGIIEAIEAEFKTKLSIPKHQQNRRLTVRFRISDEDAETIVFQTIAPDITADKEKEIEINIGASKHREMQQKAGEIGAEQRWQQAEIDFGVII